MCSFVGNKAKGRISKRVFQENKAQQIFKKSNVSFTLIHTRRCAYQGVRNVHFSENLSCFVFLKTHFEIHPFALLPTVLSGVIKLDTTRTFVSFFSWQTILYVSHLLCTFYVLRDLFLFLSSNFSFQFLLSVRNSLISHLIFIVRKTKIFTFSRAFWNVDIYSISLELLEENIKNILLDIRCIWSY